MSWNVPGYTETNGRVWLLLTDPPGPVLADLLDAPGLDAGSAATVLSEVGETLLEMHRAGLGHGAVGADSVIVGPDGAALLTEWGMSSDPAPERDVQAWADLCLQLVDACRVAADSDAGRFLRRVAALAQLGGDLRAAVAELRRGSADALPAGFQERRALRAAAADWSRTSEGQPEPTGSAELAHTQLGERRRLRAAAAPASTPDAMQRFGPGVSRAATPVEETWRAGAAVAARGRGARRRGALRAVVSLCAFAVAVIAVLWWFQRPGLDITDVAVRVDARPRLRRHCTGHRVDQHERRVRHGDLPLDPQRHRPDRPARAGRRGRRAGGAGDVAVDVHRRGIDGGDRLAGGPLPSPAAGRGAVRVPMPVKPACAEIAGIITTNGWSLAGQQARSTCVRRCANCDGRVRRRPRTMRSRSLQQCAGAVKENVRPMARSAPADTVPADTVPCDFGLLGPFVATVADQPVEVAGIARSVLALLLTSPGRVVSVEEMITGLWDEPPAGAQKAVRSYVARLRRGLADHPGAAGLVATRPRGYVLDVAPDSVDTTRFEDHVRRARAALGDDAPQDARPLLARGLQMWRGEAYEDFPDVPFAMRARSRLEVLRMDATELRFDADVALGAGAELVAELETLVREHPHRERLWEHLIVALYRSGRQSDALGAYRRARRILIEEVGVEPGPGLRRVEQAVLEQDPGLEPPHPPAPTRTVAEPGTAPPAAGRRRTRRRWPVAVSVLAVVGLSALAWSLLAAPPSAGQGPPTLRGSIPVGATPAEVAFTPDGTRAYVTNLGANTVTVIDTGTAAPIGDPITVGTKPNGVVFTGDGSRAYVTNNESKDVSVIDTAESEVIATIPAGEWPDGLAISPDGGRIFVANSKADTIQQNDTASNALVGRPIATAGETPRSLAISPDGRELWVTNRDAASVSVIDVATFALVGDPIPVGEGPLAVVVSPDGRFVYVSNKESNSVTVIDAARRAVVGDPIPVGLAPQGITTSPDGRRVYVSNTDSDTLSVIDAESRTTVGEQIPVGDGPSALAVSPAGDQLYVVNGQSNTVSVLGLD